MTGMKNTVINIATALDDIKTAEIGKEAEISRIKSKIRCSDKMFYFSMVPSVLVGVFAFAHYFFIAEQISLLHISAGIRNYVAVAQGRATAKADSVPRIDRARVERVKPLDLGV